MANADNAGLGRFAYSFAVISDTHVNPDEDKCNSPFPVNARANRRFRYVIADINRREVDFVVHLGDLLHPVPETGALYVQAANAYRAIVSDLTIPIHVLPGNHDIGDTPISGGPASPTTPAMINAWEGEFGAHYQSFEKGGVRFILLNAQLINSGLQAEEDQKNWVETEFAAAQGQRVMLMLHHPAYLCSPDELDHYDNTNQPGRSWLLGLLEKHGVEAMFSGHAHNFWYDRYGETDFYLAPATSFVRQDYSEMLRAIPPDGSEFGRNDAAKLGYFVVNVYENGHVTKFVRTNGSELARGEKPVGKMLKLAPEPRENTNPLIGFDLRQNWAEISEVLPSGGLDEFDRKPVRNDYHLLALQEMGVRDIRIPLHDLLDPARRARIGVLKHLGFRITLFGFGVPEKHLDLIASEADKLTDWEITLNWSDVEPATDALVKAHAATGLPIYISRMRTKDDIKAEGTYFHVINHGFNTEDSEQLAFLAALPKPCGVIGAVFRLGNSDPVSKKLDAADRAVAALGLKASVHLRVAGDNPAVPHMDDNTTVVRVLEAMDTRAKLRNTRVFCDTLVDVDRGYFVRHGAIDRCNNPRPLHGAVRTRHARNA
ncbi:metallophosphoesterase family protein [Ruegeria arenilitoris]|uniref:metallophosphoesterase family protein n=1 Tax=Ruegeria arenilitoris TaxID=1173585 RepID=UPI00147EF16D|nr:metallophosphoesterase [Ruegeria arenilitoris]